MDFLQLVEQEKGSEAVSVLKYWLARYKLNIENKKGEFVLIGTSHGTFRGGVITESSKITNIVAIIAYTYILNKEDAIGDDDMDRREVDFNILCGNRK